MPIDLDALLHDPLAVATIATAVAIGLVAVLLFLVRIPGSWTPIKTWLVMLPIALGTLWLGRLLEAQTGRGAALPWTILVAVVSLLAFREFARVTGLVRETLFVTVVAGAIVAEGISAYLQRYDFFMATPTWAILFLCLVPIARNRTEGMLQWLALAIVGVVFYGYFLAHLSYLAQSPDGLGYLLFVVLLTQLNDAMGYLYGKTLGRHRWTPISPNKTLEGSGLALATTVLLGFAFAPIAFPWVPPWGVLAAGLIVGLGGQVGDLTMANVKRNVGVKDFGTMLPGHGGLTDRVNSLMITAPAFAHFMGFLFGGFPS
jgi:phosphatidate cytidylyltransferase